MPPTPARGPRGLFAWLWRGYLRRHAPPIGAAFVLMALEGGSLALFARTMQPMFDRAFAPGATGAAWGVGLVIVAIFGLRALSSFGHRVLLARTGERVAGALRADLLAHLMRLDAPFHRLHPPGALIERVQADVAAVNAVWANLLVGVARDSVGLLALFAVAVSIDWRWTAVALVGVPLLILPALLMQRFVRARAGAAREAAARMSVRLDEVLHGLHAVKLNNLEGYQSRRFKALIAEGRRAAVRVAAGRALVPSLVDVTTGLGFLGVLVTGGAEIAEGTKTVGQFMAFFTAMALAFEPLRRLANLSGVWSQASASAERLRGVLDARPTIVAPARPLPPPPGPLDVEFRDVWLSFGDAPALRGLSFRAEAGRTTALVGASGAGKSTVFNVLTRLLDPDRGEVLVGGVPVAALGLSDLRALFGVVAQDAALFDDTVRDNVVLDLAPDEARLLDAVEAAGVAPFLPQLARGLDSPAGPRGSALSGGQRQRVAIARALFRGAPILLLDEATSALDSATEAAVQGALERLAEGRTTLVVAHRLSTVRAADRIVVMEGGRAVEEGRHDELLARGGRYADLHRLHEGGEP